MHPPKKGIQWCWGMKALIAVDAQSGLVHQVIGTAPNVSDISQTHALLHVREKDMLADASYLGVKSVRRSPCVRRNRAGTSPPNASRSAPWPR